MDNNLINKICDTQQAKRDLLLDELNDEIEADQFNSSELESIVMQVLTLLSKEKNMAVYESAMNLLSDVYLSGNNTDVIEEFVTGSIEDMHPSSLVHALSIIAESKTSERKSLLQHFSESNNVAVKGMAEMYLSNT